MSNAPTTLHDANATDTVRAWRAVYRMDPWAANECVETCKDLEAYFASIRESDAVHKLGGL